MTAAAPPRLFGAALALGDDNLVLSQRLAEWVSRAPDLEEDIALTNIALDHLGQARALLRHAAQLEGNDRSEDDLAFGRAERSFTNLLLVEQPNGDFAQTMARQVLFDAYQIPLWDALSGGSDATLAGIAAKAYKEAQYHFRHSSTWVVRLGDGSAESHRRMQSAIDKMWRFTGELFEDGPEATEPDGLRAAWDGRIAAVLAEAGLERPTDSHFATGGRHGHHTEHLGHLLAEMQWMYRTYPGLEW